MPVFTTPMGKTAIDESHPQFGGLCASPVLNVLPTPMLTLASEDVGDITVPNVKEAVEKADLTISIGTIASDCELAGP